MSDYCVCEDCGCKHLVWEKSCPYCRRIKELDKELDIASNEIHRLEAENKKLREMEAENKKLREHMAALKNRYPNSSWIYEWSTAALEAGDE